MAFNPAAGVAWHPANSPTTGIRPQPPRLTVVRRDGLAAYRAATPNLERFATFCALQHVHGQDWRTWMRRQVLKR